MLQKLPQLVTGSHQQSGVTIHVDDQVNRLKQHRVLGVGVLDFLGFGRLLCFVQDCF